MDNGKNMETTISFCNIRIMNTGKQNGNCSGFLNHGFRLEAEVLKALKTISHTWAHLVILHRKGAACKS